MKKVFVSFLVSIVNVAFLFAYNVDTQTIQKEVDAHLSQVPFEKFSIKVPTFPNAVFNITDAGAVGDGVTKCTNAINSTIKKCSEAGGGTVLIPAGLWLTGPITMQSNVNLHLAAGAMVYFSADEADYELVKSGSNKYRRPSLINGSNLKNIAITGKGIFNGNGSEWRYVKKEKLPEKKWKQMTKTGDLREDGKEWAPRKGYFAQVAAKKSMKESEMTVTDWNSVRLTLRSYTLNIERVEGMLVEGITLMNSPHITNMLRRINGLVMKDVTVLNEWWFQNADGLDISYCQNVLLYDCTVNTGDDGICMKSSRGNGDKPFGLENIVIKDCKVYHGHGGFVVGSNTDGGMRNIWVKNCTFSWTDVGLRFKTGVGRGGRVENVFVEDIFMKDLAGNAIEFELTYADKGAITGKDFSEKQTLVPDFDGIYFKNIYCDNAKGAIVIGGTPDLNVKNVSFENVIIKANKGVEAFRSENISFKNVVINATSQPTYKLNKAQNIQFTNMPSMNGVSFKILNPETKNITFEKGKLSPSQVEIINGADPAQVKF